jgi:hypothetical protein
VNTIETAPFFCVCPVYVYGVTIARMYAMCVADCPGELIVLLFTLLRQLAAISAVWRLG